MTVFERIKRSARRGASIAASIIRSIPVLVLIMSFVMMTVSVVIIIVSVRTRTERNVASVWGQGSSVSYRHLAVYGQGARSGGSFTPAAYTEYGKSLSLDDVSDIRLSVQGIVDLSNNVRRKASEKPDRPEGWNDCYSSFVDAVVTCSHKGFDIDSDVSIYTVGGDFKAFHPFEYLSGGFLPVDTVDKYQIVLNDELAWKFFSSYDVIGEKVTLWDKPFTVIGVVKEHDDLTPRAYVYYDCLEDQCDTGKVPAVLCYEALIPEPVSGASYYDLRNSVPGYDISSPSYYLVSITGRFSVSKIVDHMLPPGEMSVFTAKFDLPFWEVSAQRCIAQIFAWIVVFAVCLFVDICIVLTWWRGKE